MTSGTLGKTTRALALTCKQPIKIINLKINIANKEESAADFTSA